MKHEHAEYVAININTAPISTLAKTWLYPLLSQRAFDATLGHLRRISDLISVGFCKHLGVTTVEGIDLIGATPAELSEDAKTFFPKKASDILDQIKGGQVKRWSYQAANAYALDSAVLQKTTDEAERLLINETLLQFALLRVIFSDEKEPELMFDRRSLLPTLNVFFAQEWVTQGVALRTLRHAESVLRAWRSSSAVESFVSSKASTETVAPISVHLIAGRPMRAGVVQPELHGKQVRWPPVATLIYDSKVADRFFNTLKAKTVAWVGLAPKRAYVMRSLRSFAAVLKDFYAGVRMSDERDEALQATVRFSPKKDVFEDVVTVDFSRATHSVSILAFDGSLSKIVDLRRDDYAEKVHAALDEILASPAMACFAKYLTVRD